MLHIFKASAGSGKTYTLAKEYITLLLAEKDPATNTFILNLDPGSGQRLHNPYPHRSILAITFTRKATEEMKNRIIKELSILSHIGDEGEEKKSNYAPEMLKTFKFRNRACTEQELKQTATLALKQLLFDYHNFNISTIDAFFQRVLHTFARELGKQSDYTIELDSKSAMRNAVDLMLDEFNTQESQPDGNKLEKWLLEFMEQQVEEGHTANFFNRNAYAHTSLVKGIANISSESFKRVEKEMEKYLSDSSFPSFMEAVKKYNKEGIAEIKARAEALFDKGIVQNISGRSAFKTGLENLVNGKLWSNNEFKSRYESKIGQIILGEQEGSLFNKGKENPQQENEIIEFYSWFHKQYQSISLLKQLNSSFSQLGLLKHVWGYLHQFNRENNVVLLSDTNSLIRDIIGQSSTPFIYERMGVRLRHFLIDEFQDTSTMQWQNLQPLVWNGLAEGGESLIIGDEKQSIYRWRNSDSEILQHKLQKSLPPQYPVKLTGGNSTNYRSAHPIVRFNNTIFNALARTQAFGPYFPNVNAQSNEERPLILSSYENVVQNLNPNLSDLEAYIHFRPNTQENLLEQMALEMKRQHDQGGYAWNDIAVLVKTNAEAVNVVNFLSHNFAEIPVLSEDALRVGSSNSVQLILSLLRIIDGATVSTFSTDTDNDDDHKLTNGSQERANHKALKAQVMTNIHRIGFWLNRLIEDESKGNGRLDADAMAKITAQALDKALKETEETTDELMQNVKGLSNKKPISLISIVETLIESLFNAAQRKDQYSYLSAFQDLVIDFSAQHQGSVHAFLDWWDQKGCKANISGAAEADAVQVLTVHKSKGLEFACVHIPYCSWPMLGTMESEMWIDFPKQVLEKETTPPPSLLVTMRSSFGNPGNPLKETYDLENQRKIIDNANVTYVAFTRAIRELLVWYGEPLNNKSYGETNPPIGRLLSRIFTNPALGCQDNPRLLNLNELYKPETQELIWGHPTCNLTKTKDSSQDFEIEDPYPVFFPSKASTVIELDSVLDTEEDLQDEKQPTDAIGSQGMSQEESEAIARGKILHSIMERIYSSEDIDRAVEIVRKRKGLSAEQVVEYSKVVRDFFALDDSRLSKWFSEDNRHYMEQTVFTPGAVDRIKRPDRLIVYPKGPNGKCAATVLDYKFTKETDVKNHPEYISQVQLYMSLAQDLGYGPVDGYLCFPLAKKIIEVK